MDKSKSSSCCCPVYCIIETLSKKWVLLILRTIAEKKKLRFSEIKQELPEINSRILSERLSELEEENIIKRVVQDTKPITISYEITDKGADLKQIFECFVKWAKKWGEKDSK